MDSQYKKSLEFTLNEIHSGLDIAREDFLNFAKENAPYFVKGAISSFVSLLPFQERHEFTPENFSKWKTIYYTSKLDEMNKQQKISAGVGFLSSLGVYYGIGTCYTNASNLLCAQALILIPFSMQYVLNCQPKTIRR